MSGQASNSRSLKFIRTLTIGMGAFIATFDVTAVSLALPAISKHFALDVSGYVWVMDAYSLAFAIALITAGAIADRHGQKLTLVAGAAVFLAASVLCAYAGGFGVFIAGRVIQGVGAAFVICGGVAMAGRMFTDKAERVQAFGIIGTVSGSALAVGPALGGLIANALGWTWVFLINIPICLAIIGVAVGWMDEHKSRSGARMDVPGVVTVSAFLLGFIWFLLHGPAVGSVVAPQAGFLLALGLVFFAFLWIEVKAVHPAVDIALFKKRDFLGLSLVPLALSLSYWGLIVFLPLFLQRSLQLDNSRLPYAMLFFTLPMFLVPMVLANGAVARRAAAVKQSSYYFTGLLVVSLGCLAMSLSAYFATPAFAVLGMVVAGVGASAMQSQVSGALIASAPLERAGNVTAISTVLRQGGFAIGTALLAKLMEAEITLGGHAIAGFPLLFFACAIVAGIAAFCTLLLTQPRATYPATASTDAAQ